MSFKQLYEAIQLQEGRISTKWLREQAIKFSDITAVKEQWSGVVDAVYLRGFYLEGPMGPPTPLKEKEAMITLSREMCTGHLGTHYRRFVYTKELMHVFDEDHEKANTPETFDQQIEKFGDPSAEVTPQYRAEAKAFWRALGVLCQEQQRLAYKAQLEAGEMSLEVIATALHLPPHYVRNLFREDFAAIINHLAEA